MPRYTLPLILMLTLLPYIAEAAGSVSIPSYASGQNLTRQAESAGENIADFLLVLAGIIGVLGGTWGGILMAMGKGDEGKQKLVYAVVGVFVAASIGGILKLVL